MSGRFLNEKVCNERFTTKMLIYIFPDIDLFDAGTKKIIMTVE